VRRAARYAKGVSNLLFSGSSGYSGVIFSKMKLALFALVLLAQERKPPDDVAFERDLVYGKGGGEELKLNLSRPKSAEGALPCVLVIHGGGWAGGHRAGHDEITWKLAKRGYVSATVGYRLAPRHRYPAAVEDVKCAVRYLRANAEKHGIDRDRLAAIGFSAGGHLSMMLGVMGKDDGLEGDGGSADQSSQVQCVVSFFGPANFLAKDLPETSQKILATFMGGTAEEKADDYKKASPVTYVSKGDAPMLLFQGTKDPLVPHSQALAMLDAMTAAGVPGRVELLPGAQHGWGGPEAARTEEATYAFLDLHLKKNK